jgi:exopolysaccharide/PEP-CTERM locus tyrosine autokinase
MSKIFEALQKIEQEQNTSGTVTPVPFPDQVDLETGFSDKLVVLKNPGSVAAEQFRFLRSLIVRPQEGRPPRTILITSSLQGEGKTFTACNLAVTIALGMDEHVLLVDADLRNPNVHSVFGLDLPGKGLANHLEHNEPLENLLLKTSINKLTLLPAGPETENPAELLSSKRMHAFISQVRDRYPDRFVIFDSPPVNLAPETMAIANEVDAVFLLLLRGRTPRQVVKATMERFKKEKLFGLIFNEDRKIARARQYSYGYGYGYGYSYGKGKQGPGKQ